MYKRQVHARLPQQEPITSRIEVEFVGAREKLADLLERRAAALPRCEHCGSAVGEADKYCANCGAPIPGRVDIEAPSAKPVMARIEGPTAPKMNPDAQDISAPKTPPVRKVAPPLPSADVSPKRKSKLPADSQAWTVYAAKPWEPAAGGYW